jgi:hypothetical protein
MRQSLFKPRMLKEIRPLWPVDPLIPFALAPCPHGVVITEDRICLICYKAAQPTQEVIDALPTPAPVNPETRALEEIAFHRDWLASHPRAARRMKIHIKRRIRQLEKIVREYIPTRYLPAHLKGGTG